LKVDFEEYQEDSKTLENELETQLKQLEQKNKDLAAQNCRLQNDNENLRVSIAQKYLRIRIGTIICSIL